MSIGDCDDGIHVSSWSGRVPPGVVGIEVAGDDRSSGENVCGVRQNAVDDPGVEIRGILVVDIV